jgi:hypothetical protein
MKFGQTSTLLRPRPPIDIPWGDRVIKDVVVHDFVEHRWSENLKGAAKTEAELLPAVAELANQGVVSLLINEEVRMEWGGLRGSFGRKTIMNDAPITSVDPPMKYGRIVAGGSHSPREYRDQFILSVHEPRFLTVASACGAFDGKAPNVNALWDAFHVWSAEVAKAEFFLTLDFGIVNRTRNRGSPELRVAVVKPSELIRAVSAVEE